MIRVCIHQPDFAPHLAFYHRLLVSDVYIVYDDAQFVKGGWHYRDLIKTPRGQAWLALSIAKGDLGQKINAARLSPNEPWVERNLNLLQENYRKARHFSEFFPHISEIYHRAHKKMMEINLDILKLFFELFEVRCQILLSSELNVSGGRNEKLVNLIKAVGGTHYVTGSGSRAYLDEALFQREGIVTEWQEFRHPVYPQLHGDFLPGLSCFDILLNCGRESRNILKSCIPLSQPQR